MTKPRAFKSLLAAALVSAAATPALAQSGGYGMHASAPVHHGASHHAASQHAMVQTAPTRVDLNHTTLMRLPYRAAAVVVGNPLVADVAVHSTDTILILGRSYGTTNILAMDSAGRVIANSTVTVGAHQNASRVQIFEGNTRRTFDCTPRCNPAPELGDRPDFFALYRPETQQLANSFTTAGSMASGGGASLSMSSPMSSPPMSSPPMSSSPMSGPMSSQMSPESGMPMSADTMGGPGSTSTQSRANVVGQ